MLTWSDDWRRFRARVFHVGSASWTGGRKRRDRPFKSLPKNRGNHRHVTDTRCTTEATETTCDFNETEKNMNFTILKHKNGVENQTSFGQ